MRPFAIFFICLATLSTIFGLALTSFAQQNPLPPAAKVPVEAPQPAPAVTSTTRYIVTLQLSQSRLSLSISDHIKDAANSTTMQLPVDKEFYDSVEVGTVLNNSFRSGSFIMKGSFGSWKVKVIKKETLTN